MNLTIDDNTLSASAAEALAKGIAEHLHGYEMRQSIAKLVAEECARVDLLGQIRARIGAYLDAESARIAAETAALAGPALARAWSRSMLRVAATQALAIETSGAYLSDADRRARLDSILAEMGVDRAPGMGEP